MLGRKLILPVYKRLHFYSGFRTFKKFGHARDKTPLITVLWHSFLVLTFTGCAMDWDRIFGIIKGTKGWKVPITDKNLENLQTFGDSDKVK